MTVFPLRLLRRPRILDPDKLLLRNYRLTKSERVEMFARGVLLTQFAIPIGSALYFLFTQVSYQTKYHSTTMTWLSLKDSWDRLPVHVRNLFHAHWFAGQAAPAWWVVARHDFRHVLIGVLAVLLVGAFGVGLKQRKPRSPWAMAASVPVAFLAATAVAGALIVLFAQGAVYRTLHHVGTSPRTQYLGDLVGRGTLQLTLIGVLAGFAAKKVLARTFYTLQGLSIQRHLAQGHMLTGWRRFVYPANYRNRFAYEQARLRYAQAGVTGPWLGVTLSLAAPVVTLLLAFGIWLNYFGPAAHAH